MPCPYFIDSPFTFPFVIPLLCPSKLGAKRVFRGMTECHSVPFEGSTLQCDARKTPQCDVGQSEAEGVCSKNNGERGTKKQTPSGALLLVPLTQRDKVDGHVKLETLKHESERRGLLKKSGERRAMSFPFSVFIFPFVIPPPPCGLVTPILGGQSSGAPET